MATTDKHAMQACPIGNLVFIIGSLWLRQHIVSALRRGAAHALFDLVGGVVRVAAFLSAYRVRRFMHHCAFQPRATRFRHESQWADDNGPCVEQRSAASSAQQRTAAVIIPV